MKNTKVKIILFIFFAISIFFFSNNEGLVDIEKTAIIKAVGIDYINGEYVATAQIAVPEANDTNTENNKTEITASGSTIGNAIKNVGDVSGWYPQLAFCNLIVLGQSTLQLNVIKVVDYFSKTLRVQDSALIVVAEGCASDLLKVSTPLDNVSSIALQKKLLKNPGFDQDVATNDIKTFCTGYYSRTGASFIPLVKIINADNDNKQQEQSKNSNVFQKNQSSQQQNQNNSQSKCLFNTDTTLLFKNGKIVGELTKEQTKTFNALTKKFEATTIKVDNVQPDISENKHNYLVTVMRCTPRIKLIADENNLKLQIHLNLYCKIADQDAEYSDATYTKNTPMPQPVIDKTQTLFHDWINQLIETTIQTECDFLKIKDLLYKYNHNYYPRYKDNYLQVMNSEITVKVSGQK
jgi:spore germination protein KC